MRAQALKTQSPTAVSTKILVPVGPPVTYNLPSGSRFKITATPGSGGTLLVEYQDTPDADWDVWPAGASTARAVYLCDGPIATLRFTATVATGTVRILQ